MRILIAILLFVGMSTYVSAFEGRAGIDAPQMVAADGLLQSVENANVTAVGNDLQLTQKDAHTPIELIFTRCHGLGVQYEENQWWVLPTSTTGTRFDSNRALWILPVDAMSKDHSWHIKLNGGDLHVEKVDAGLKVTLRAQSATLSKAEARPHSDPFGHRFSLEMPDGPELEEALAAFYWGTILP